MVKKTPAARAGRFDQVLAEMRRNPGKVYTLADLLPVYGGTLGGLGQALGKAAREGMVGKAGRGRFFVGPAQKAAPSPKGKPDARPREKAAPVAVAPAGQGNTRSVQLRSGGVLTITVSTNVLDLDADDRAFVFGLVDAIAGYGG